MEGAFEGTSDIAWDPPRGLPSKGLAKQGEPKKIIEGLDEYHCQEAVIIRLN